MILDKSVDQATLNSSIKKNILGTVYTSSKFFSHVEVDPTQLQDAFLIFVLVAVSFKEQSNIATVLLSWRYTVLEVLLQLYLASI